MKAIQSPCVECRKLMVKAQRVHKGHRYCTTCYAREFKHRLCPSCGNSARLPRFDEDAVCLTCSSTGPCVRCRKEDFKTARITEYGRVCPSCTHYFSEPEPCEACGQESTRLSKASHLNHDMRICQRCFTAHFKTCSACHRYRKTEPQNDGRQLCLKCATIGEVDCIECGKSMPAGRGKQCESCYWSALLEKRLQYNLTSLNRATFQAAYRSFAVWLSKKRGNDIAAMKINRYQPFFRILDTQYSELPNYERLLAFFKPEGLRKYRSAIEWMDQTGVIEVDQQLKDEYSEAGQIDRLLNSLSENTVCYEVVKEFYQLLDNKYKAGKIKLRTVRLVLSSVVKLVNRYIDDQEQLPKQQAVTSYLTELPGQRANITGFVNFLNREFDLALSLQVDPALVKKHLQQCLENEILEMCSLKSLDKKLLRRWIISNLQYHHNFTKRDAYKALKKNKVDSPFEGQYFRSESEQYWIPGLPKNNIHS